MRWYFGRGGVFPARGIVLNADSSANRLSRSATTGGALWKRFLVTRDEE